MGSGRCALSVSELMRQVAEDGSRRHAQGCRSFDAIAPASNGHNGPWDCGFLQVYMHNAAVTGVVVQPDFRHTRPRHGPPVRQACWCCYSRTRVAREVAPPAKRGQGSAWRRALYRIRSLIKDWQVAELYHFQEPRARRAACKLVIRRALTNRQRSLMPSSRRSTPPKNCHFRPSRQRMHDRAGYAKM